MSNRIYLDFEATGRDPATARIVQIGIDFGDNTGWEQLVNPGMPIPLDSTEVHKITDAMVADAPTFADLAAELAGHLAGKTIVTFGGLRYDIPLLSAEFERAGVEFDFGSIIDAGAIFAQMQPRRLTDAVRYYCNRAHGGAHTALADATATQDVFLEQLKRHPELNGKTDDELAILSNFGVRIADPAGRLAYDLAGKLVFNTRKNKGIRVVDEVGYATWMLNKDFPEATKRLIRKELDAELETDFPVGFHEDMQTKPNELEIPF